MDAHKCINPGVTYPYDDDWNFNGEREHLAILFVENATQRVLYAGVTLKRYLNERLYGFVERHLPADQWEPFRRIWLEAEAIDSWLSTLELDIAAGVMVNLPPGLGIPSEMVQKALDAMGLCCDEAVDAFIADRAGPDLVADMQRQFPDFRAEWLTLQGARNRLEER